jgi:hypothetical protein
MATGPLTSYLQDTRNMLGDQSVVKYVEGDLVDYINEGRQQLALETGCCRQLIVVNLVALQELYSFASITLPSSVEGILAVQSISVQWSGIRFTLRWMGFSRYQALIRNYVEGYNDVPSVATKYGQGEFGSVYVYPVPDQAYVTEWDCICNPASLINDASIDLVPGPFKVAVAHYATFRALNNMAMNDGVDKDKAAFYQASSDRAYNLYKRFVKNSRAFTQPGQVSNWYGRR